VIRRSTISGPGPNERIFCTSWVPKRGDSSGSSGGLCVQSASSQIRRGWHMRSVPHPQKGSRTILCITSQNPSSCHTCFASQATNTINMAIRNIRYSILVKARSPVFNIYPLFSLPKHSTFIAVSGKFISPSSPSTYLQPITAETNAVTAIRSFSSSLTSCCELLGDLPGFS
jgi:hypothetical protein